MICSGCGVELDVGYRFCPWCGAAQPDAPGAVGPASGDGGDAADGRMQEPRDAELRRLRAAVNWMTAELGRLSRRLAALESGDAAGGAVTPPVAPADPGTDPAAPPPQGAIPDARDPGTAPASPPSQGAIPAHREPGTIGRRPRGRAATPYHPADAASDVSGRRRRPSAGFPAWNWEWLLGGNWLARIGVVALVIGAGFFISLAIENGWLGERARVFLGVGVGLGLVGAGEGCRRRYPVWAQAVAGGGIGVLYLSVYGAFALYGLVSPMVTFGAFFLITLGGAGLALRHEAMGVAVLAIFGGFATPLLLSERLPEERLLLAYVLLLDLGVLGLAGFRNWRWFNLLGWGGSMLLFGFWQAELAPSFALAQVGASAIFLIFVGASVAFPLARRRPAGGADLALAALNAAGYYGISYWLIGDEYRPWLGGFTAALAAFYVLLAAAGWLRGRVQLNLTVTAAGLAAGFALIAAPVQWDAPWVSIAWGVEGLVLLGLSFPLRLRPLRWFGYGALAAAAAWLLILETPDAFREEFAPLFNDYMASYGAAVILCALAGGLLYWRREVLAPAEGAAFPALTAAAGLFAAVAAPTQLEGVWVSIVWAVQSALLMALAGRLRPEGARRAARWFAYLLLAALLVRLAAVDTFDWDADTFRPILNLRFLAFAAGIAALYWAAYRARRDGATSGITAIEARAAPAALLALASLATLWILSAEIMAAAGSVRLGLSGAAAENVASLGLSLLWGGYAAALLAVGIVRRWRWVRVGGLALLAAPVVKLFAFDSRLLEQEYRVIAFIALGLILVAGGLLYQRYRQAVRGFLFE